MIKWMIRILSHSRTYKIKCCPHFHLRLMDGWIAAGLNEFVAEAALNLNILIFWPLGHHKGSVLALQEKKFRNFCSRVI